MNSIAVIVDSRPIDSELIDAHMKHLPGWDLQVVRNKEIHSSHDYNNLLRSTAFWESFLSFERVLLFQHDTMILRPGIEEFMEWDYVGSPWNAGADWARWDRAGGNGGLSLRNPVAMIETIQRGRPVMWTRNEDVFFTHRLSSCGFKVAPFKVCVRFSCEAAFALGTFGYHNIYHFFSKERADLIKNQYA